MLATTAFLLERLDSSGRLMALTISLLPVDDVFCCALAGASFYKAARKRRPQLACFSTSFCGVISTQQRFMWAYNLPASERPPWWGADLSQMLAEAGALSMLQWARVQGSDWDERTCGAAARQGHAELLQWAREQGCPWN